MSSEGADPAMNALVAGYLESVAPELAGQFTSKFSPGRANVSLSQVLQQYNKSVPPKRKLSLTNSAAKKAKVASGTEDSESDSESSDSDDAPAKKKAAPPKKPEAKKADSSSDDSSSEDDAPAKKTPAPAAKPAAKKAESSSDDSSSEDEAPAKKTSAPAAKPAAKKAESSSDDSSSEDEAPAPSKPAPATPKPTNNKRKAESSSDDSSDDEDDQPQTKKFATSTPAPSTAKPAAAAKESSSSDDSSSSDEEEAAAKTKKQLSKSLPVKRAQENSDSGIEDVKTKATTSTSRRKSSPFRRVKSEDIDVDQKYIGLSKFESKNGFDEWGAKANLDMIVTQGKSFQREKTKKKRGAYRGGFINTGVNSIKFDSD